MGIGKTLKLIRIESGIKQKDLAKKLGTSATYLSLIENDKKTPSISYLQDIANCLKVPMELLLLESAKRESMLLPQQLELFERAKSLLLEAIRIERNEVAKKVKHRKKVKDLNPRVLTALNINSLKHLSLQLDTPLDTLQKISGRIETYYLPPRLEKKSSGGTREINRPKEVLKAVQRSINKKLLKRVWLPDSIHAYRDNRSIITSGEVHKGKKFLMVLDIKEFYPSISYKRVYKIFQQLNCSPDVTRLLTALTTYKYRLPQGAPTSPSLANLFIRTSGLEARLRGLTKRNSLNLSFFGDDILISGESPFEGLRPEMTKIIQQSGLMLNVKKTRVLGPNDPHFATGILMNSAGKDLNVPKSYRKKLRAAIHNCIKFGPSRVVENGQTVNWLKSSLRSKIAFAMYVNPKNKTFLEMFNKIDWEK